MDEDMAWNRFLSTGKIEDYLIYKDAKAQAAQNLSEKTTEEKYEPGNGWSDTKGAAN